MRAGNLSQASGPYVGFPAQQMAVCSWCSLFPCVMSRVNESLGVFNMTFQCLPLSRWKVKYASHLLWLGVRLARPSRSFPHRQNPYSGVIQDINDQFPSCGAPCPPCNYEVGPVPCETHGTCTPCSCLHLVLLASFVGHSAVQDQARALHTTTARFDVAPAKRTDRGLSAPLFDRVASRFPHLSAESTGAPVGPNSSGKSSKVFQRLRSFLTCPPSTTALAW